MTAQNDTDKPHKSRSAIQRLAHSTKGTDLIIFIICVGIASIFWLFLSLYEETEKDFEVPFVIENVPDSIVIVEPVPASFNVMAQGKGVQFLKMLWHDVAPLKVNFKDYARNGQFTLSRQKLDALLRDYFGVGVKVPSVKPESVKAAYTSNRGKRVPLELDCDVQTNMQYVISGPIEANVDSVMIFSATDATRSISKVTTYPLIRAGLKDTTVFRVKIKPIEGVRIIPDAVTVKVPVEPLIAKKRTIPIEVMNVPADVRLLTFPSTAEISYLVPMNAYNKEANVRLFVDYASINRESKKVRVQSSAISGIFRKFSFRPDSVEYIIESRRTDTE